MQSGFTAFKLMSESILPMYFTTPGLPRRKRKKKKDEARRTHSTLGLESSN